MPKRVQRKRTKGWRMPPNCVYVGRPTKWGNPYRAGDINPTTGEPLTKQEAVDLFEWSMTPGMREAATELAGKDLACFCGLDGPCHADVLLDVANGTTCHYYDDAVERLEESNV